MFAKLPDKLPVQATVLAPPVEAKALAGDLLTTTASAKLGKVKVDEPSPAP